MIARRLALRRRFILPLLLAAMLLPACRSGVDHEPGSLPAVNLTHILALLDSLEIAAQKVAFVHIYAEFPSYAPVPAPGEGISAVDDVGRLLEVLEVEVLTNGRTDLLPAVYRLTDFILAMQRDDGLWYNFIHANGAINTSHKNSVADFGWWAARGLRGLAAAYMIFRESDPPFAARLLDRFRRADAQLQVSLTSYPALVETPYGERAGWLPYQAPDMSAEFILPLIKMQRHSELDYRRQIAQLAAGIMTYQLRDSASAADGMFYSWQNSWHNWGNLQARALLEAFEVSGDSTLLAAVERWAGGFLTWQVERGFIWGLAVSTTGELEVEEFPQIAYGLGSIYKGIRKLAAITGDSTHAELARQVLGWFSGANRGGRAMYDPATGRCYDGINGPGEVNLNSGAESTIEALQALQYAHLMRNTPERQPDDPDR